MGSIDDIMQLCRLCLVKDQVNIPIFEETSDIGQTFVKINQCLPVKVSRDDNLPKKICDGCSYKLDMLYVFRNTSVESEKQLVSWLSQLGSSLSQTIVKDGVTKPEIMVKQETFESTEARLEGDDPKLSVEELGVDAHTYIMQQQKLPYQQDFAAFGEPSGSSEEPPPKKAKRAVTVKKQNVPVETEEDALETAMQITKAEQEEDSDDVDQPDYVEAPSTSADDQPGPSGVGKGTIEAPFDEDSIKVEETETKYKDVTLDQAKKVFCKKCNLEFAEYRHLRKHRNEFHLSDKFRCEICHKVFKDGWNLNNHKETHSKEKNYYCEVCDKYLKTNTLLKAHKRDHAKPEGNKCQECGKSFKHYSSFRRHVTLHKTGGHPCEICGSRFKDRSRLRFHMKKHDDNYVPPTFTCEFCEKVYTVEQNLKHHIQRTHKGERKTHICETCGKTMSSKKSLRDHQYIHTGEKPYPCQLCEKSFRKKEHLTDHLRMHNNETPHACDFCEKTFTTRKGLKSHLAILHEGKKHLCETCGKAMASTESLKVHKRMHTGEKPFACSYCQKTFAKKQHMTVHLRVHTKERPHACKLCDKKYTQGTSLSLHVRAVHSGEKPFSCTICSKKFVTKSLLNMHYKSH